MATLAALRARVRARLEEASAAVWTDAELDECISGALEEYGWRWPRQLVASVAVSAGATELPIPGIATAVLRVALTDGTVLPRRHTPAGNVPPTGEEQAWEAFAGVVRVTRPLAAGTLAIWHLALPALDDVPVSDEGLLVLGAVSQALEARAIQDAKRGIPAPALDTAIRHARDRYHAALDRRGRRMRVWAMGEG